MARTPALEPGRARVECRMVGKADVSTTRTKVDYHSRSIAGADKSLSQVSGRIFEAMHEAAKRVDNEILAEQRPGDVRHGVLVTPGRRAVLTHWLVLGDDQLLELVPARPYADDYDEVPEWGDDGWEKHVHAGPPPGMIEEE